MKRKNKSDSNDGRDDVLGDGGGDVLGDHDDGHHDGMTHALLHASEMEEEYRYSL